MLIGLIAQIDCLDRFGRRRTMIVGVQYLPSRSPRGIADWTFVSIKFRRQTGAIVMGLSYMLYGVLGAYSLYPNNDDSLTPKRSTGSAMIFVICIFVLVSSDRPCSAMSCTKVRTKISHARTGLWMLLGTWYVTRLPVDSLRRLARAELTLL